MTEKNNITRLGNFFYRYRAIIAVPFFIVLILLSKRPYSLAVPVVLTVLGLALRSWAAGYIGNKSRGNVISADYRITNGPYRFFRHPLYLSNFLLVGGTLALYNPGIPYSLLIVAIFIVEYGIIARTEDCFLAGIDPRKMQFEIKNLVFESSTLLVIIFIYAVFFIKPYLAAKY